MISFDQSQILAAAVLDTLQDRREYAGHINTLFDAVKGAWEGVYDINDLLRSLIVLERVRGYTRSAEKSTKDFVRVNAGLAIVVLQQGSRSDETQQSIPLLYEYSQYGHDWLEVIWSDYFPKLDSESRGGSFEAVPASDRMVSLNHNDPNFEYIKTQIAEVQEAVRGSNDTDPVERERIVRSLSAAAELWQAGQLKLLQLKVGVLLAAEDARIILQNTAKVVAAALLVDTIKAFIKMHSGIDLDHI